MQTKKSKTKSEKFMSLKVFHKVTPFPQNVNKLNLLVSIKDDKIY